VARISNDGDFRTALGSLSTSQQRRVGADFVTRVMYLLDNARLRNALATAQRVEASEDEIRDAQRIARGIAVESYTVCGEDGDWRQQAGHFVAAATTACLAPEGANSRIGWAAAMNARMAKTCSDIANGTSEAHTAAEDQYAILERFLQRP